MVYKKVMFFLLSLYFVNIASAQSRFFVVKGKIDTVPYTKYAVLITKDDSTMRDSIQLDDKSNFCFQGQIDEPALLLLESKLSSKEILYGFWVEPNKEIEFFGKKKNIEGGYEGIVKNSETDLAYRKYLTELEVGKGKPQVYKDSLEKDFITQNKSNYFSLRLLYFMLESGKPDYNFIHETMEGIPASLAGTSLANRIRVKSSLRVGNTFPDMEIDDLFGKPNSPISSSAKYTLIDFWASWCVPCRQSHPILKQAFEKYKSKEFNIVSISFDNEVESWKEAIEKDGLNWMNLCDLQGMRKGVSKTLAITRIPTNFLVDSNGVILAVDIDKNNLMTQLEKYIK